MNRDEREKNIKYDIQLIEEQKIAKEQILKHPFNFLIGPAGSGKTMTACAIATDMLFKKQIKKIVITRPTVATEEIGFLPGNIQEKMDPWLVPIRSNFRTVYNKKEKWEQLEKEGIVEIMPLTYFRGQTFSDAICIIDEFENLTQSQLKMCIGRLGKNSIMIFCGDEQQIDLKNKKDSAFYELEKIKNSEYVYIHKLIHNHRHIAVFEILELLK